MNDEKLQTIEQVNQFLEGSEALLLDSSVSTTLIFLGLVMMACSRSS